VSFICNVLIIDKLDLLNLTEIMRWKLGKGLPLLSPRHVRGEEQNLEEY